MKKDSTRRAVERAAMLVRRAQVRVRERVPYGPTQIRMSPAELRRALARASGETRARMVQELIRRGGLEKAMEIISPQRDYFEEL